VTQAASGEHSLDAGQIFSDDETNVFTHVVTLAEKAGKHVELMVVPGSNPYEAVVQTAARLQSSRIVMGLSPKLSPSEQGAEVGYFWEQLPEPRPSLSLEIVLENSKDAVFLNLGPHPPRLWPEDIELAHRLWLELTAKGLGAKLHHRDVIGVALRRMRRSARRRRNRCICPARRSISGCERSCEKRRRAPEKRYTSAPYSVASERIRQQSACGSRNSGSGEPRARRLPAAAGFHFVEGRQAPFHRDARCAHAGGFLDGAEDGGPLGVVHRAHGDAGHRRFAGDRFADRN
jgi:hypothetical protein